MTYADTLTGIVNTAKPTDLPQLAAELGRALAAVIGRVASSTKPATNEDTKVPAALLTVEEAAARLRVPRSWLYRNAKQLPFTRKLGHRTLRFDAAGLEKWAASRPQR